MAGLALGVGLGEFAGELILQGIYSISPRRSISWQATDSQGNAATTALRPANGLDLGQGLGTSATNSPPVVTTIYPQVVVREHGVDRLEKTKHPVEVGAVITDHAYKQPAQVDIIGGWSYVGSNGIGSYFLPLPTDPTYLTSIYNTLLQIQQQRSFVTLVTGKRVYNYMLLTDLAVDTDEETENILGFTASFEEVLLATTQTVTVPNSDVMKTPSVNAATTDQGNTSLTSGSNANLSAANASLGSDFSTPVAAP